MKHESIYEQVEREIKKQRKKPWPVHIVAQASKVNIPAGELLAISDSLKYTKGNKVNTESLQYKAVQTIAASILFIENINKDGTASRVGLHKLFTTQHREVDGPK